MHEVQPEGQEARSNAGIQRLKSLGYRIHPWILPLRASRWLFTKTDGFSFEHHVFCDGPKGESQGCDE